MLLGVLYRSDWWSSPEGRAVASMLRSPLLGTEERVTVVASPSRTTALRGTGRVIVVASEARTTVEKAPARVLIVQAMEAP